MLTGVEGIKLEQRSRLPLALKGGATLKKNRSALTKGSVIRPTQ